MDFSNLQNRERFVIELFLGIILITFLILLIFLVVGTVDSKENNVEPKEINIINSYNNYVQPEIQRERQFDSRQRIHDGRVIYYDSHDYYDDHNRRESKRFYRYEDRFNDDDYDRHEYYYDEDESKDSKYSKSKTYERPLEFDDDGRQRRYQNLFDRDVDDFEVYVHNDEDAGGLFEVTFTFEDAYGRERKASETKYIYPGKEQKFLYREVSPHYSEYKNWRYEVKSHSEVPYKTVYYN